MGFDKRLKVSVIAIALVAFAIVYYVAPSLWISEVSGPILNENWWQALNWIKENTPECSVIATYWDPGHFISGIAERAVIYDGASQNSQLILPYNGTLNMNYLDRLDNGIVYTKILSYDNPMKNVVIRSRMKDVASVMMTGNETFAVDILKDYAKTNPDGSKCPVYFLATADLVLKSGWWTLFATWDPTTGNGNTQSYSMWRFIRTRAMLGTSELGYEYAVTADQSIVLCDRNGTLMPCAATSFDGVIVPVDATGQVVLFIPPDMVTSLFTRMFFQNGAGLEKFKLVDDWGGEIKLFEVDLDG